MVGTSLLEAEAKHHYTLCYDMISVELLSRWQWSVFLGRIGTSCCLSSGRFYLISQFNHFPANCMHSI